MKLSTLDFVTSFIKRAADLLFVLNPRGTSVGAFVGVAIHGLLLALTPAIQKRGITVDVSRIEIYHSIAAGVAVFNIPALLSRRRLPDEIENRFEALRRVKGELSPVQMRMQYLALCAEVIAKTQPRSPRSRAPLSMPHA